MTLNISLIDFLLQYTSHKYHIKYHIVHIFSNIYLKKVKKNLYFCSVVNYEAHIA